MCCGKYWSEMTLHMRVFFMYTHIAVVLLDVTKMAAVLRCVSPHWTVFCWHWMIPHSLSSLSSPLSSPVSLCSLSLSLSSFPVRSYRTWEETLRLSAPQGQLEMIVRTYTPFPSSHLSLSFIFSLSISLYFSICHSFIHTLSLFHVQCSTGKLQSWAR